MAWTKRAVGPVPPTVVQLAPSHRYASPRMLPFPGSWPPNASVCPTDWSYAMANFSRAGGTVVPTGVQVVPFHSQVSLTFLSDGGCPLYITTRWRSESYAMAWL